MFTFSSLNDRCAVLARVLDPVNPELTRWILQWGINRAAGRGALRKLTDEAARRRQWHRFTVRSHLLERFKEDVRDLRRDRKVQIVILRRKRR